MCIFVIAKLILVYFIAWAIFFMILALIMLSCASGRQTLEKKMLVKLQQSDSKIKRLPQDERSFYWRTAIRLYSIALPFYCMCLVLFYYPPLQFDIACELQYLKCSSVAKSATSQASAAL